MLRAGGKKEEEEEENAKQKSAMVSTDDRVSDMTHVVHILCKFDVQRAMHHNIPVVKPTRCTTVSNSFYFGMTLCMFRTVFPSIVRSSRLYIQQQAYVKQTALSV
jgi:hypothetical protein